MVPMGPRTAPCPPPLTTGAPLALLALICWGAGGCQGESLKPDAAVSLLESPGCGIDDASCGPAEVCQERVCYGVGWTCAMIAGQKEYGWSRARTCEVDGDPCTIGTCYDGACVEEPMVCPVSSDPCTPITCIDGICQPTDSRCSALPHTMNATCAAGGCEFTCEPGWGDCDGEAGTGCEADLTTDAHCGSCQVSCDSAVGSICVAGRDGAWACSTSCSDGWDDCDGDASTGCETHLRSIENCGRCDNVCPSAPNADPACRPRPGGGDTDYECTLTCQGSYDDCDGDPLNGCEVPVGVANSCDLQTGLRSSISAESYPCGTAYCGQLPWSDYYFQNFPGNYFCVACTNCHYFQGMDQHEWCHHSTGLLYFPPDDGNGCGSFRDLVCEAPPH